MKLRIDGIATKECVRIWDGGLDANGQPALVRIAEGPANPCRHCLRLIPTGHQKLVLAYRPFAAVQPYAETGPIFLHAEPCERYEAEVVPPWFDFLDPAIVRGSEITNACRMILGDGDVAYVHVRSKFNCFQCRVDRG